MINKTLRIAGYLILSAMVLLLFGFTFYHAWSLHSLGKFFVPLTIVGLVYEIVSEGIRCKNALPKAYDIANDVKIFIAILLGAIITYTLKVNVGLGAVLSAGLVALIASLTAPRYGVAAYCGSFVGMTSSRLLVDYAELSFAAVIAGVVFLLADRAFNGFGGKLGTVAFTGTLITGLGLEKEFLITHVPEWDLIGLIIFYSILATAITYWLNVRLKHGGVVASGIVGLTGGLILPAIYPDGAGNTLAVMVICASFAGMSSAERFPHMFQMLLIGLLTGMIYIYSMPLAGGAGGKLGTIAFGSVLVVRGYMDLINRLFKSVRFDA